MNGASRALSTARIAACAHLANEQFPNGQAFFTTRELLGDAAEVPAGALLVGPARPLSARAAPGELAARSATRRTPLVVVSFGTQLTAQPDSMLKVAHAAAGLDIELLINGGQLANTDFAAALPGTVTVLPKIAQREALPRASALVTHGGWNSVTEALDAGVPMLVSPFDCDQPVTAYFARQRGVGIELDLRTATVDECRRALSALTPFGSSYARAAREVQTSYHRFDGGMEVALATERIAERPELSSVS